MWNGKKKKKNGTGRKNLQGQKQAWRSVGKWKPAGTRVSQQALPFHNFFPFHWKLVINQLAQIMVSSNGEIFSHISYPSSPGEKRRAAALRRDKPVT